MADTKLSSLTALTSVANGDLLYLVDDPAGTPASRKATVSDVLRLAYGGIYINPASPSSVVLTSGVYADLQFGNDLGVNLNATEDGANHRITLSKQGVYLVEAAVSLSAPGGTTLSLRAAFGGTSHNGTAEIRMESSGYAKSVSIITLLDLSAASVPDHLTLEISADDNVTVTGEAGTLVARRLA